MRSLILSLCLTLGQPLAAQALDAAGFEAEVTGQTLEYNSGGHSYGTEQYLPGREVIWQAEGGDCRRGRWYEDGPKRICFVYEGAGVPQCWGFTREGKSLTARFEGQPGGSLLREVNRSKAPLRCNAPFHGV